MGEWIWVNKFTKCLDWKSICEADHEKIRPVYTHLLIFVAISHQSEYKSAYYRPGEETSELEGIPASFLFANK